ncbi:MAG: response regulator [Chitinophagaceae bacterium]|nr:MAG: response regulator [Chitinophagaceae bacterium]
MNNLNVVWADDDDDDLKMFNEAAEEINHELKITGVHNGRELLNYLHQAAQHNKLPSMIIMDMNMPLMSGREALIAIKNDQVLQSIPVVVFTTSNSPVDTHFCTKFHVMMFTKPWLFSAVKDIVREILKHRATA